MRVGAPIVARCGSLAVACLGAALLSGCGPNCESTCQKIYGSSECNIRVPGRTQDEMIKRCVDGCDYALRFPGDLGDYDPNERHTSGETVELENEKQAGAWMDCVNEVSCSSLNEGFCAPI